MLINVCELKSGQQRTKQMLASAHSQSGIRDPLVEIYKSNDEFKFIFSIQCTKLQIAV